MMVTVKTVHTNIHSLTHIPNAYVVDSSSAGCIFALTKIWFPTLVFSLCSRFVQLGRTISDDFPADGFTHKNASLSLLK